MKIIDAWKPPTRPVVDGEPCDEAIPIGFKPENGWFGAFASRAAYWSVLAGTLGHSYGHHRGWQMWCPSVPVALEPCTLWSEAIYYPGAYQVGYLKALMESLPWFELVPDEKKLSQVQPPAPTPSESQRLWIPRPWKPTSLWAVHSPSI